MLNRIPKLHVDARKGIVTIGRQRIPLRPMEFVYYRYFVEQVLMGKPEVDLRTNEDLHSFATHILDLHRETYPRSDGIRIELERFIMGRKESFRIGQVRTTISKINKKINDELLDPCLGKMFRINAGQRGEVKYALNMQKDHIALFTPAVYPMFKRNVICFAEKESLVEALKYMRNNKYSQVIVRDRNHRLRLLTNEGLAVWLAKNAQKGRLDLKDYDIGDVLESERSDAVAFCKPTYLLGDARNEFHLSLMKNCPLLFAIIITDTGLKSGKPLGIITPWDFLDQKYW